MPEPPFAKSLLECDDETSVVLPSGARFIRKLPDDREFSYLHRLYAPASVEALSGLRGALGRELPDQLASFLSWANGASLFEHQLHLYGSHHEISRRPGLEHERGLSIVSENRFIDPARSSAGWIRVGSVSGWDSQYHIDVHASGRCEMLGEKGSRAFADFHACMEQLVALLKTCFSCDGAIDPNRSDVEQALKSLIRAQ